jgi:hypothetical protein
MCARTGPDEYAVLTSELSHFRDSGGALYGDQFVDQITMPSENARDEAVGDAFYQVVPDLSAHKGAGLIGLDGYYEATGVACAKALPDTYDSSSCTYSSYDGIRADAQGKLLEDFWTRPWPVLVDIPFWVKLLGGKKARLRAEIASCYQRIGHVKIANGHNLGTERSGYGRSLDANTPGHYNEHSVTFGSGHHAHGVSCVATTGLNDGVSGL